MSKAINTEPLKNLSDTFRAVAAIEIPDFGEGAYEDSIGRSFVVPGVRLDSYVSNLRIREALESALTDPQIVRSLAQFELWDNHIYSQLISRCNVLIDAFSMWHMDYLATTKQDLDRLTREYGIGGPAWVEQKGIGFIASLPKGAANSIQTLKNLTEECERTAIYIDEVRAFWCGDTETRSSGVARQHVISPDPSPQKQKPDRLVCVNLRGAISNLKMISLGMRWEDCVRDLYRVSDLLDEIKRNAPFAKDTICIEGDAIARTILYEIVSGWAWKRYLDTDTLPGFDNPWLTQDWQSRLCAGESLDERQAYLAGCIAAMCRHIYTRHHNAAMAIVDKLDAIFYREKANEETDSKGVPDVAPAPTPEATVGGDDDLGIDDPSRPWLEDAVRFAIKRVKKGGVVLTKTHEIVYTELAESVRKSLVSMHRSKDTSSVTVPSVQTIRKKLSDYDHILRNRGGLPPKTYKKGL